METRKMRKRISLNQDWKFAKTDVVPASFPEDWESVTLPHTWNAKDGQDGGNDYYRGTCMYARKLNASDCDESVIEFEGAANSADVYLNGTKIGHHDGGFSTFRYDLTPYLKDENLLCVAVDNSANDRVYPQTADFTFYGGIYRDVNLLCLNHAHFAVLDYGTPGITVTSEVNGDKAVVRVSAEVVKGSEVVFATNDETKKVTVQDGKAEAEFVIDQPHLWNGLEDPYLYEMKADLYDNGTCTDSIAANYGIRTIVIDAKKGFLLNGREYPLRGVSRHQDRWAKGNAISREDMEADIQTILEVGANSIRLAHYQHNQYFYDLCDKYGLLIWAEIPYITQHMDNGNENTKEQLKELIIQNKNHPSIYVWSLSNEITVHGVTDDLIQNHLALNDLAHSLDATRPTVIAHAFMLETDSPVTSIADVNTYNLYFGWYLGTLDQNEKFFDNWHAKYPAKPIGFSEYGADANPAFHSDQPEAGDYSEEYQCVYHEHMLKLIEERPWIWCSYVWNMFDFAADGRDEGGKHGQNQKGLVCIDHKTKKDAFYLYQAYWAKKPMLHVCGRRYVRRCGDQTEVKVYSNQKEVSLYVNGSLLETKSGDRVFTFEVPMASDLKVKAVSGDLSDEIEIQKVAEPEPSYQFMKIAENWFDKEDFDENYFSIKDTLGELLKNPKTGPIVGGMMKKAQESRGDVAKAAGNNANMMALMAGMTLESLIKRAGDSVKPEQAKQLNDMLQKIHK